MKIDGTRAHDRATEQVLADDAAFNRGDWAGLQALLCDDVVHDLNQGPRETGRPAFAAFQQRMARCCHEQLRDVRVLAAPDGSRAAAEYVVHREYLEADEGLPPAHGRKDVLPGGTYSGIREGRIASVTHYHDFEHWLAQVR